MASHSQPHYVTCPACQALNARWETVCDQCGGPIGHSATPAPDPTTRTQDLPAPGQLASRPRPLVLIGYWAIFLPVFVSNAYGAFLWATHNHGRFAEFIFFCGAAGLAFLSSVILYWATKKYVVSRSKNNELNDVAASLSSERH